MEQPKKLIEVAMPIKEISAESIRDKSIRHGHISTLHLWWARRPLPVCRAVVFASLVPDPLDVNCPKAFKDAVEFLLGKENNTGNPYKPYDDIPYTAAIDKMDDNLRNRLLMFIGKFSDKYIYNERHGKKTDAKDQLNDACLIKWDNKHNEEIIGKARKLIWIAHNSQNESSFNNLLKQYNFYYQSIKDSENKLYSTINRHLTSDDILAKEQQLKKSIDEFLERMPKVFDPFAGGGAIPLEVARLGCRSFGNDINPVAYIVQKGSLEFPQKFGKPISYTKKEFILLYGEEVWNEQPNERKILKNGEVVAIKINNRLSFDIEYYSKFLLSETEKKIGQFYPKNTNGKRTIAYYWARTGICSNPTCKAEVPLLKQFNLSHASNSNSSLIPIIKGNNIEFKIGSASRDITPWNNRTILTCPCCGSVTDTKILKQQFINKESKERLLAVIVEGNNGKEYRLPNKEEIDILKNIPRVDRNKYASKMQVGNNRNFNTPGWGIDNFNQMFNDRQLLVMHTLVETLKEIKVKSENQEYKHAIITYLAILINRIATRITSFGLWNTSAETLEHPFGRQAIPMVFDFPEVNPFSFSTGGALSQIEWIIKFVENEENIFSSHCINASSGDRKQFDEKYLTSVVTDPPYYDAIAYADLSDFFYLWFKNTQQHIYPLIFATPQTPKSEECTALRHHHNGDLEAAKKHFETKLTQIFESIECQTSDIVSIMFAHQSTEAWSTLCNAILKSKMNFTGSWAIDTERSAAGVKTNLASLSSSVTVCCIPYKPYGIADYKKIKKSIEVKILEEVNDLYRLGFRGSDLLTACFGQAVSVFGQFEKVEKADGNEVTVTELLEMAKESAFNALLKGFDGDDFTKFYIGWLQLYGFAETDFDDAAKFARVGLTINVSDLFAHNLFIKKGNKQELAGYKERLELNHRIGEGSHSFIIDFVHKAMALHEGANRNALLAYIAKVAASPDNSFWRVITSLCEILPQGSDDYKQASGLLLNKDSLIRESKNIQQSAGAQGQLF